MRRDRGMLAPTIKQLSKRFNAARRLDGHNQLPKIVLGIKYIDGIEDARSQAQAVAA